MSTRSTLNALSNRAEAEMRLGNLDEAVAGYRDVIERIEHMKFGTPGDYEALVLARWGLAVALDCSGDPAEAEHEAFVAAHQDPEEFYIGRPEPEVFFVPAYERSWYLALGRTQHAKHEPDVRLRLSLWNKVVKTWVDYVSAAGPHNRWVALARAHLASAEAEQREAAKRFAAMEHVPDELPSLLRRRHPR